MITGDIFVGDIILDCGKRSFKVVEVKKDAYHLCFVTDGVVVDEGRWFSVEYVRQLDLQKRKEIVPLKGY